MYNSSNKIHRITLTALLVAIIFLLAFTPLGYLVIGPIAATTIQMPVVIGAVLMGPVTGLVLGTFFGLSAIVKVLTMPGADPFATMALTYSPLAYITVCIGSRMLMGWLTGLLGVGLRKIPALGGKRSVIRYGIAGFSGSLMNTVFYLGLLWLLAREVIATAYNVDVSGVGTIVMTTAVTAGLPEAAVSCVVVGAVCRALEALDRRWFA